MSSKQIYIVTRAMHGDGKDYARGDTRQLSETDAAPLVAAGALAKEGEEPTAREPAVRHTFGTEPSKVNDQGYTSASGEGIKAPDSANKAKVEPKGANKAAG